MARIIRPVVGETNPTVYSAAKNANLNPEQQIAVEQLSYTVKKAKQLRAMNVDQARREFDALNEDAQNNLRALYPSAKFLQEDPTVAQKALGILGQGLKSLASPFIATYKVAAEYGKALNTGYVAGRQIQQGASPFSLQTWDDAYNGREAYDKGAVIKIEQAFGAPNVFVAKGLLAGKTPGEIVESYGKVDNNILNAITTAYENTELFDKILAETKAAQISPGRDLYRSIYTANQARSGNLNTRVVTGRFQSNVS